MCQSIEESKRSRWLLSYIDLLRRFELWCESIDVASLSGIEKLSKINLVSIFSSNIFLFVGSRHSARMWLLSKGFCSQKWMDAGLLWLRCDLEFMCSVVSFLVSLLHPRDRSLAVDDLLQIKSCIVGVKNAVTADTWDALKVLAFLLSLIRF